jgi:hypothetical protein
LARVLLTNAQPAVAATNKARIAVATILGRENLISVSSV